jgi:hypothetical protein
MTPALNNVPAIHHVYHISVPDRREPMSDGDDRRRVRSGRDLFHGLLDLGLTLVVQSARRLCKRTKKKRRSPERRNLVSSVYSVNRVSEQIRLTIKQKHLGLPQQRTGYTKPLPLSATQLTRRNSEIGLEALVELSYKGQDTSKKKKSGLISIAL